MAFWRELRITDHPPRYGSKEQPPLHIHFAGRFAQFSSDIFQHLPLFSPLNDVKELIVGGAVWGFKGPWGGTLAHMPSIETLYLWSTDIKAFLRHLATAIPDSREKAASLPRLKSLVLEGISFNGTMLERLPKACKDRKGASHSLKNLQLKKCWNILDDWKKCLPFVENLDWDGHDDIDSACSDSEEEALPRWI
ncbi:hypothetical protein NLI96_g4875 [Meripilus lineatus]|uniref:Uncharacterized protein n=1 Tax=Meripilus lineatus TaxID=2056292 RepID=A0AAD5V3S8_9APHY|nr:hypothetical protein NLI96_g4875 [Physisporinus lineatus]